MCRKKIILFLVTRDEGSRAGWDIVGNGRQGERRIKI